MKAGRMVQQSRVLESIDRLTKGQGYPPTYRELASDLELSVSAVHRIVHMLRDDGRVICHDGLARSLVISSSMNGRSYSPDI